MRNEELGMPHTHPERVSSKWGVGRDFLIPNS